MQTDLIAKARSSRIAALANLSTKRDVSLGDAIQTRHQRFETAFILRRNVPALRDRLGMTRGYAQVA